jgi:hypothetical protein
MGLKELAASVNIRPELTRHPKGRAFEMKFPIIQEKVAFEDGLNEELISIIRDSGDTQRHRTNVKANMTDWFMHKQHPQFQTVGDKAISIARKNSPSDIGLQLFDCWGAIYQKDDWTKAHDHWPHPWSFVYYIQCDQPEYRHRTSADLIFPDGYQGEHHVRPLSGDMVLFPGWLRHKVNPQLADNERIVVAGNLYPIIN